MSINKERLLENLLEIIKIDSESLNEQTMVQWIENYFKKRGAEIYKDNCGKQFGGNGSNVLIHIRGNIKAEPICFVTHLDTVAPGKNIEPTIENSIMKSSGNTILAGDDKGGIVAILEAIECINENKIPHRDIYVLFTICEEIGMLGAKSFDVSKLATKNVVIVDAVGPAGIIAYAAPAKDYLEIRFIGKKAHAGIEPEKGINAVYIASRAINNMILGRIDEITTANIGRIEGGGLTNIVTDEVIVTLEVRSHDFKQLDRVVNSIKESCYNSAQEFGGKVEIEVNRDYPIFNLNKQSFIFKHCIDSYKKEGIEPTEVIIGGGSDANILAGKGFDCAIISCGMDKVHTVDEVLNLDDLYNTSKVLKRMIQL